MLRRIPYFALVTIMSLMIGPIAQALAQPGPQGKEKEDKKGKKGDQLDRFGDRLERLRRQFAALVRRTPSAKSCCRIQKFMPIRRTKSGEPRSPISPTARLPPRRRSFMCLTIWSILRHLQAPRHPPPRMSPGISRRSIFAPVKRITFFKKSTTTPLHRSCRWRANTIKGQFNPMTVSIFAARTNTARRLRSL